jgi:hypothetical protein
MSTEMHAMTILIDPAMAESTFDNAYALLAVEPAALIPSSGLTTFFGKENWVINNAYGSSRHNWFCHSVAELCFRSGIKGLEFLCGDLGTPCRWKLPLGIEDGEEEVYGYVCGYWLEGSDLQTANAQLRQLLSWARDNVDRISDSDFLGYFADDEEIAEAIEAGQHMDSPKMREAMYAEDGDGPGYLFAYLGTCSHLFSNAALSKKAVLHVAEIFL